VKDHVWSWKGTRPPSGWRSIVDTRIPWSKVDWSVVFLALLLVGTSLAFVHQMSESDWLHGRDDIVFESHLKKYVVAAPFLLLGFFLRPRWLRRNAWLAYGAVMLLLCLVPVIGEERNNARRWIAMPVGSFDLQPSELAKIGLILILARSLYRNRLQSIGDWVAPALFALLPMALVVKQPDLGTALTVVPVTLGMFWLAGAKGETLVAIVLVGIVLGGLAWQLEWVQGYQKKRIDVWAQSYESGPLIENKNGAAFHPYHARMGIGNGGLLGTGLGRGVANEAGHLPERESDSIFAVVAEEGGFVGATLLVVLYLVFSSLLLVTAARTRERFSRLVVGGVALFFAAHFFINVGVNLGLLPMTGLTLPLISTGGSSLMASFLALGLALGLSARREPSLDLDAFRA
jgi:rod shape determining protein RodA